MPSYLTGLIGATDRFDQKELRDRKQKHCLELGQKCTDRPANCRWCENNPDHEKWLTEKIDQIFAEMDDNRGGENNG